MRQDHLYVKGEYKITLQNMKHYLRRGAKGNKTKVLRIYQTLRQMQIHMNKQVLRTMKMLLSIMPNIQTHYHFKQGFHKVDKHKVSG